MKKILLLTWFSLVAVCRAFAQDTSIDTIMQLDTLNISAERYEAFSTGQNITRIELGNMHANSTDRLSNTIRENTSVYIRSYGPGSVSSMSIRGTSSSQSGIFWNGINIRMPSLGSTDLSLIPSTFFNNATIVYGGSSVRYGSGLIGGAVFLNSIPDFGKNTMASIGMLAGSFGNVGTSAQFVQSGEKYYINTVINGTKAENNFDYYNDRNEERKMENAASNQLGLHSHMAIKLWARNQLDLFIWYQEAGREIPPTASMAVSQAYQSDRVIRTSLQWRTLFSKGVLKVKTAWFNEYENYTDPLSGLSSKINTNTLFAESEYRRQLFRHANMIAGLSYTGEFADIEAYGNNKDRMGLAMFVHYRHYIPGIKWTFFAGARQELNENTLAPFTPSLGMEGPVIGIMSNKFSISRNYRLPTLNELYWQPGGNPDIKPEESWNAEMSLLFDFLKSTRTASFDLTLTGYMSYVDNWILWKPFNNYWKAENIQEVWARGVETNLSFDHRFGKSRMLARLSYTYSRSSSEADDNQPGTKGKQILYTPLHNAGGKLAAEVETWQMALMGNYTGSSYTTSDNSEELPAFFLTDISLQKQFLTKYIEYGLALRVNNVFDVDYQLVAYRPMPGRNYQLTLQLTFKKPAK